LLIDGLNFDEIVLKVKRRSQGTFEDGFQHCGVHLLIFTPRKHCTSTITSRNIQQKSRVISHPAFQLPVVCDGTQYSIFTFQQTYHSSIDLPVFYHQERS
jgi:hypothetical protein